MQVNWMVYVREIFFLTLVFTGAIMIPLCRNPVWWIHDYPKDIQEEYFKTHERIPAAPLSRPALIKKGFAILLVSVILSGLTVWAGARRFGSAFLLSCGIWMVIDWYDCFFLDWVLFENVRKIRLPGTEHMDKAYHQKGYHFVHSVIGMAVGLVPCGLCGLFVGILF